MKSSLACWPPTTMGEDDKALSSGGNGKAHHTAEEDIPSKEAVPLSSTSPFPSPPHSTAPHKQPIRPKPSFFTKLVGILIPCVSLSSASRSIEPADLPHRPSAAAEKTDPTTSPKKPVVNGSSPHSLEAESEKPVAPIPTPSPASPESPAVPAPPLPIPPPSEVQTPEDTAGLTSSAVQAPGSTGEVEEKPHTPPQPTSADAEDSEGTSYSEDEDLDEQDEEERLLMNGGAGIPIGPVCASSSKVLHVYTLNRTVSQNRYCRPFPRNTQGGNALFSTWTRLWFTAASRSGTPCVIFARANILRQSISQADYVVPVEIEYHWHNVYVIKRPGVDNFLKKMGELYEVVVFTASLSKVSSLKRR